MSTRVIERRLPSERRRQDRRRNDAHRAMLERAIHGGEGYLVIVRSNDDVFADSFTNREDAQESLLSYIGSGIAATDLVCYRKCDVEGFIDDC